VIVEARLGGLRAHLFARPARQRDQHEIGPIRALAQAPRYLIAVHTRQAEIQNHATRLKLIGHDKRLLAFHGNACFVSLDLQ